VANTYLEGTYSEVYPAVSRDAAGLARLFTQFSFPGGIPSHAAPETPGSIHEGGELGYALLHAYGAAFDNPGLVVCCVVGDGEAETGALAASWHSNKFVNPATDGAVLPVLHLNGTRSPGRPCWRASPRTSSRPPARQNGHEPHTSRPATSPRHAPAEPRRWTPRSTRSRCIHVERASGRSDPGARLRTSRCP
jgi:xylulose-5-phosphate/fructose-6-phosphate phosphoketolase